MNSNSWSAVQLRELEALAAQGLSGRQIGERLGFTRNAVLGQARRSGIKLSGRRGRYPTERKADLTEAGRRGPGRPSGQKAPVRSWAPMKYAGIWGRSKGQYIVPRPIIIPALAAHLAGVSAAKAAKAFDVYHRSILNWKKRPELVAEAAPLAERALAEARERKERLFRQAEAQRAAEDAHAAEVNERVYLTLKPRVVQVLRAYSAHRNMAVVADMFGVSRERVRQIVVMAEAKGFIAPCGIVRSRRRARYRRAA